jgi:hypothetical protein
MIEKVSNFCIRSRIVLLLPGPLISGLAIYFVLSEFLIPFRIIVPSSILVSVLIFGLANYYRTYGNNEDNEQNIVKECTRKVKSASNVFFIAVYLTLIIYTSLAPPNTEIFIHWGQITLSQLMGLAASIVICIFAPGYALISTIDRKSELTRLSRLLFAYLLSILATGLFGLVISSVGMALSHTNILLSIVNALILAQFVAVKILDRDLSRCFHFPNATHIYQLMNENISRILVFASLFGLVVVSTYVLYNGAIVGDQWFHHGRTFMFLSGAYKHIATSSIDVSYPPFQHAFLAAFFALSSVPSINSYVSISFLNIMPAVAFYYFFSRWIPCHRKTALLATSLFMLSSGFGWMYALNLAVTNNDNLVSTALDTLEVSWIKTFDIFTPNTFVNVAHPDITTGLIIIGLPAGFVLLGFLKEGITNKFKYTILIATICVLGILTHDEFLFFIIIAAFIPLIFRLKQGTPSYTFAGILIALSLVVFLAIFLPGGTHYYMTAKEGLLPLLPLLFLFVTFMWTLYLSRIISHLHMPKLLWKISRKVARPNSRFIFAVAIISAASYFYILSFLIWDMLLLVFDVRFDTKHLADVPWFFYPLRFGTTGLFALSFVISYIFKKYEKEVLIFALIAVIAYLTGSLYSEFRFSKYIMVGMAGFASLMIYQIISSIRQRISNLNNIIISGLLIGSVITSAGLSIVMYVGYSALTVDNLDQANQEIFYRRQFPSDSDIHLMDFLRNNLNISNDNVAIPEGEILPSTGLLGPKIEGFAGHLPTKLTQTPLILEEPTLNGFYMLQNFSNSRLIVLPREYISNSTFMSDVLKFALRNFPRAYEDANYVVLSVPTVAPPSSQAEIALVSPRNPDYNYYYTLSAIALAKASYDIYEQDDYSALSKKVVILTSDPSNITNYLEYVKVGGTILIMNTNKDFGGGFSNLLCIKLGNERPFDSITSVNGNRLAVFGETRDFRSFCSDHVVKSFYSNNNQRVAPFVTETNYGNGKIIFVNAYGYFAAVSEHPAQFFSTLGNIARLIELKTNDSSNISTPAPNVGPFPFFFGDLYMSGQVSIESSSMSLPSNYSLLYAESILFEKQDQEFFIYNSTSPENKNYFSSPYVKNLKLYGAYDVIVNTTNLLYSPSSSVYRNYIPLDLPAGSDMTIKLSNGSSAEFVVGADHMPVRFTGGGEIKFKNIRSNLLSGVNLSPSVSVLLKSPEIATHGNATFLGLVRSNDPDNPTKFISNWNDLVPKVLQVRGGTTVKLDHVVISNGTYTNGEYATYFKWIKIDSQANQPQHTTTLEGPLEIPWQELLGSEANSKLAISLLVAASASVYIGLASRKVRSIEGISK